MSYENPQVPHEVNVSRENPVTEFLRLAAGLALVVLVISALLYFFGGKAARLVPFSYERSWVGETVVGIPNPNESDASKLPEDHAAIAAYVQRLAQDIAAKSDLPEGMDIRAHFYEMDLPNAFATLGGHVVITRGLYVRMPSENALATVIAHEIGHVKGRDPIEAIGGSALLSLAMSLFSGNADSLSAYAAQVVALGYSRDAESQADNAALLALRAKYGHAGGAAGVFEIFQSLADERGFKGPTLLSTHPADAARIEKMKAAAEGWDEQRQPLRPLEVSATLKP